MKTIAGEPSITQRAARPLRDSAANAYGATSCNLAVRRHQSKTDLYEPLDAAMKTAN